MRNGRHLPRILARGLDVVFCGTAAGTISAARGHYYAGPGNQFWGVLARTGLTERQFLPCEFRRLSAQRIGLTDLVPLKAGMDRILRATDFDRETLMRDIRSNRPQILAFNGKKAASVFFDAPSESLRYGEQRGAAIDSTDVWIMPSTSGAARGSWDESIWLALAMKVRRKSARAA